jgi:hypothetical protein
MHGTKVDTRACDDATPLWRGARERPEAFGGLIGWRSGRSSGQLASGFRSSSPSFHKLAM